jgi:hypothetical protein
VIKLANKIRLLLVFVACAVLISCGTDNVQPDPPEIKETHQASAGKSEPVPDTITELQIEVDAKEIKQLVALFEKKKPLVATEYLEPSKGFFLHLLVSQPGQVPNFSLELGGENENKVTGAVTKFAYDGQQGMYFTQQAVKTFLHSTDNKKKAEQWISEQFSSSVKELERGSEPTESELLIEGKTILYFPPKAAVMSEPQLEQARPASDYIATAIIYQK